LVLGCCVVVLLWCSAFCPLFSVCIIGTNHLLNGFLSPITVHQGPRLPSSA
jgi:hypothetical protein